MLSRAIVCCNGRCAAQPVQQLDKYAQQSPGVAQYVAPSGYHLKVLSSSAVCTAFNWCYCRENKRVKRIKTNFGKIAIGMTICMLSNCCFDAHPSERSTFELFRDIALVLDTIGDACSRLKDACAV